MTASPYNPLDKLNLARSIQSELLSHEPRPIGSVTKISGAGVYVIYYIGAFLPYEPISLLNRDGAFSQPIYVGKAIPKGGRKGGLSFGTGQGTALADRIRQHAASISDASNIDVGDFFVRHLVVDDIWIPLGENVLIESFKPVWNRVIDGFGNKDPGNRRATQYRSPWDVLHPGRSFATKLANSPVDAEFFAQRVCDYLAGRPLAPLPRVLEDQVRIERANFEESADEA